MPRRVRTRWLSLVPAAVLLLVAAGCAKPDTSAPANAAPASNVADVSAEATGPGISLASRSVSGTTLTTTFKAWGGVVNVVLNDGTKKLTEGKPVNGSVTLKAYNLSIGVHSKLTARGWTVPPGKIGPATAVLAIPSVTISAAAPPPPPPPSTTAPAPTTTTVPPTTVPVTSPPAPIPVPTGTKGSDIGFSNGYPNGNATTFGRELDMSKSTGAQWYRGDVTSVALADYVVPMTRARGVKFLAVLGGSMKYLDANMCSAVVSKYGPSHGGGINAVELLNEPDLPAGNSAALTPAAYLAQVKPCAAAIRAADPAMPIVVGAVSMAAPGGPRQWVQNLYAANGNQPLPGDALSLHPYVDGFMFNAGGNWSFTADIHNIMASHGDGAKKIWATETGMATPAGSSQWANQASAYMSQAVAKWHAFGSWAGVMFLYQIRDMKTGDGVAYDNYGILDNNFNPKPGYAAFTNGIANS